MVGSINTDLVAYVDRLPRPGETVGGARLAESGGGKGANQAVAASRAGAPTAMVSAVGDDEMGEARLRELREAGVDVRYVAIVEGVRSGVALINVDRGGENQIAVAPGANAHVVMPLDVAAGLASDDVVVVQNEIPLQSTVDAVRRAKAAGATVVWNAAPALPLVGSEERAALAETDYLVVNAVELAALLDGDGERNGNDRSQDPEAAAQRARAQVGAANVLLTMSERGACLVDAAGSERVAAPPVDAVDTVGAGDCLAGVFAAGLALGLPAAAALQRAVAAAALSVTRRGAQASMPPVVEIDAASH